MTDPIEVQREDLRLPDGRALYLYRFRVEDQALANQPDPSKQPSPEGEG